MVLDKKHALLRHDLEPAFDEDAVLAVMEALAKEAGDWRKHLPHPALCDYSRDAHIRHLYQDHVMGCRLCQELIDIYGRGPDALVPDRSPGSSR